MYNYFMEIIFIVIVGVVIFYLIFRSKDSNSNVDSSLKKTSPLVQSQSASSSVTTSDQDKPILRKMNTSLLLKRGEVAYFEINSTLGETRAERVNQSVFIGKRQKNTFFGGSSGSSKSHQVLTEIDKGKLILTNKRLSFDGKKTNRNIKLNKLMSVEIVSNFFSSNQLELSIEGRKKSMYFSVPDTHKYKELIMQAYKDA